MRKRDIIRFDLDKTFYLSEYQKAVSYGNQKINIKGVKAEVSRLNAEKEQYIKNVSKLIEEERKNEEDKYLKYKKWSNIKKKAFLLEILFIMSAILYQVIFKHARIPVLLDLLTTVIIFAYILFIGPLSIIISAILKKYYGSKYQKYIESISARFINLGNDFYAISHSYYDSIDNLYLCSLDAAQREIILLRRDQEKHNQEMKRMEEERQLLERQRLAEQQRARAATENLLAIEQERERRYRSW